MKFKQEVAAAAAATCWQGSDCRNNAHTVMNILAYEFRIRDDEAGSAKKCAPITSAAAKENEEFLDKDVEILRTHRGEEKHTQRRETTTEGSEQAHKIMHQRKKG